MNQGPFEYSLKSDIIKFNDNLISNYNIINENFDNNSYKILIRIRDFSGKEMQRYIELKNNLF